MKVVIVCTKFSKLGDSNFTLSLYLGLHDMISISPTKCSLWLCFAILSHIACILLYIIFPLMYLLSTLIFHSLWTHFNLVPFCHHSNEIPPSSVTDDAFNPFSWASPQYLELLVLETFSSSMNLITPMYLPWFFSYESDCSFSFHFWV